MGITWTSPFFIIIGIILILVGIVNLIFFHSISEINLSFIGDFLSILIGIGIIIRYFVEKKKLANQLN
tara:strand:- start:17 stop:220 length:204 start_codon:yes stop_codon:yes gene_type:complete